MHTSSDQEPGEKSPAGRGGGSPLVAGSERQVALQRVMVYLRALQLPPVLSLELALESLRKAGDSWSPEHEGNLPSSTMQTLWGILASRGIRASDWWDGEGQAEGSPASARGAAMPPLCRRSMLPENLDRRPWITFMLRGVKHVRALGLRSGIVRHIVYLALLLGALYYLLVKLW